MGSWLSALSRKSCPDEIFFCRCYSALVHRDDRSAPGGVLIPFELLARLDVRVLGHTPRLLTQNSTHRAVDPGVGEKLELHQIVPLSQIVDNVIHRRELILLRRGPEALVGLQVDLERSPFDRDEILSNVAEDVLTV